MDQLTSISALRIATSPLYSVIIATRTPSCTLLSPLEILINRYEKLSASSITDLEKIAPFCVAPWWIPPPTVIHKDKMAAKSAHDHLLNSKSQSENLVIYTDGSGINRKIGAAAVGPNATWNSFLGPAKSFTVYSAELYGIYLATEMTLQTHYNPKSLITCVDSQSAIRAIGQPKNKSGQHILYQIVHNVDILRLRGFAVELHWGPAHIGIEGNEPADKSAKEATGWKLKKLRRGKTREEDTESTAAKGKYVKELLLSKKTQLLFRSREEWKQKWSTKTRGWALHKLEPSSRKGIVELHLGLTKELSALVIQMRTKKNRSPRILV